MIGHVAPIAFIAAALALAAPSARADEVTSAPPVAAAPPAAPYSLPWQLRPVTAATVVRSDTTFAAYENVAATPGATVATSLLASVRVPGTGAAPGTGLAPLVRLMLVGDSPPSGTGGVALVNPLLGATYALSLGHGFRGAAFLGLTVPIGMGGGDMPDAGALDARTKGVLARAAMDNALFAVNDFAVIPGLDVAWVGSGVTLQAEATLLQLTRVRGAAAQPEASKTNFTCGLHAGWFVAAPLSFGAEIRYQRWLNAPIAVDKDPTHTTVDNLTFAVGPRLHVPLGGGVVAHPGIAYARGLDKPMAASTPNYHLVQLDLPIAF